MDGADALPEKVGAQRHHAAQLPARSNVFVERLWRSVKYERVYLKAYDSVSVARADIADYMSWYNDGRVHSSLDEATPDEHYFANLPALKKAA
jgi:putative transposase